MSERAEDGDTLTPSGLVIGQSILAGIGAERPFEFRSIELSCDFRGGDTLLGYRQGRVFYICSNSDGNFSMAAHPEGRFRASDSSRGRLRPGSGGVHGGGVFPPVAPGRVVDGGVVHGVPANSIVRSRCVPTTSATPEIPARRVATDMRPKSRGSVATVNFMRASHRSGSWTITPRSSRSCGSRGYAVHIRTTARF